MVHTVALSGAPSVAATSVLDASGYVTARRQATVSSKVTGRIIDVFVEEGMRVGEDQILARLDPALSQRQLALAEAQLERAVQARSEVEVLLDQARIDRSRIDALVQSQVRSVAERDSANAEVKALEARSDLARQEVEVARQVVELRLQELDDLEIRAPFAGVVVTKDAQPGEMISPVSAGGGFTRTGICTLVDMTSLEVEVDVNEAYINRVEVEQPVEAVLDAYPDRVYRARVITPVPTADRQKATVLVRIAFEELDARILPDMGVKVRFLAHPSDEEVPAASQPMHAEIPRSAVEEGPDGTGTVLVLADERLLPRRVQVIGTNPGASSVSVTGLREGERIALRQPESWTPDERFVASEEQRE